MPTTVPTLPGPTGAGTAVGVDTHCPYCALQCAMHLSPGPGRELTVHARDFPTNRGGLCQKGWTAAELLTTPDRLTTPLMRASRDAPLEPVSWDVAMRRVAVEMGRIQRTHGRDAVAVFGGGGLTNEKAYTLGKFARVALRTKNIDYNGRFCMSSAAAASTRAFGVDRGLPFPIEDVAAADAVLLVGGNSAETMPPFVRHLEGAGRSLVVVDPRATETAKKARLHLQPTPGTDLALALGMLHVALVDGLVDDAYVAARTSGWEDVARTAATWWPERVERTTGVPVGDLRQAVHLLAEARTAVVLTGRGAEQHSNGTDTVTGFINLALALGLPGRPGSGYGCLTGQGNGQGGREHGQKADQLPGYRSIEDPAARAHVASVWGVEPESLPGKGVSAYELLDSLGRDDGPKALLLAGSNPLVSAPNARSVAERIAALDFLVVSDFVLSETGALADVVLPTTQWAEEDGTMTNLEGRVLLRRKARPAPPGVRSDLEILAELARHLGSPVELEVRPRAVFDELRRASAGGPADYSGITYERIALEGGVFWPCRDKHDPGTRRMFLDSFATPDGLARFVTVEHRAPVEQRDDEHPHYLTTGRVLHHYQSGAQTRRVPALVAAAPEAFVELSYALAESLGISAGELVRVTSRRGSAVAPARLSDDIRDDTVFMPFHWAGRGRVNSVTSDALDPVSRMPEFKVCAVRVERAGLTADDASG
ncbi:assimilatory nitrate reductase catalytic subunit [Motilibacter peucedani]|uniref:Assimilatory nitrate reductase catalytic subunit n=1 Tax=Motilibacter peucedani TaxID=598650 RepID=A0A420XTT3_9ACTN|nr:molybdopterin oxidoreductase family protein [Motilibacter peucedani]RKS80253.1 assimilatory nitrate reductase catalytic subunit [Motilibacter peucedani]